jgi:multidrug efflux pump subunit AcrA (membrane-fusion protein)
MPRPAVQVVPVIVKRSAAGPTGTKLFQAAGWIEPRPTPISVAALAPGVIEQLMVVEGQQVEKDQPIARLISVDAELAVQQAEATLAIREGELARAEAERKAAQLRLENPVHLQVQRAEAESALAKANTELAKLPFLIEAAEASVEFMRRNFEGKLAAESAIAGRIVEQTKSQHVAARANLQELLQRGPNLNREAEALQAKVDAIAKQIELLIEERRQLEEARAKVQSTSALRDEARLQLRKAELTLQRNVIRAPMTGRILRLVSAPGMRVMGLDVMAVHNSSTVVEMYDPARLQVRADVRLEDLPMVTRGQRVEIETASSADPIEGRVLRATSTANIQKNTLEVKVELIDPPQSVSPEMLVTATFLAPDGGGGASDHRDRIFIPEQLVRTGQSGSSAVWIVDPNDLAQQRVVALGQLTTDGLVEVVDGLNVTDKLVASDPSALKPGRPVNVAGEDVQLGM